MREHTIVCFGGKYSVPSITDDIWIYNRKKDKWVRCDIELPCAAKLV